MDFLKHGFRVLGMLLLLIILRNVSVYKHSLVFVSGMPNNAFLLKTIIGLIFCIGFVLFLRLFVALLVFSCWYFGLLV